MNSVVKLRTYKNFSGVFLDDICYNALVEGKYDEKDKEAVLIEHNSKAILPFYISWLLIILKTFYYKLGILSENTYTYLKNIIMDVMVEGEHCEFITTDVPEHKPDKK